MIDLITGQTAKRIRGVISMIFMLMLLAPVTYGQAGENLDASLEDKVKAAFVFNFISFVEWPDGTFAESGHVHICVAGTGRMGGVLRSLEKKEVKGKTLRITYAGDLDEMHACHLLYIEESEKARVKRIEEHIRERPILSISDMDGFGRIGGIITFIERENRIRFIINNRSAKLAGLKISSKLLNLASEVIH